MGSTRFWLLGRRMGAALLACVLVACGGGGSGGGGNSDLAVGFAFSNFSSPLFQPVQANPQLSGLGGRAPICGISSGSLPPGLSIGQNCSIAGVPTSVGEYSATIVLTVDGYGGSVSSTISIGIQAPVLAAVSGPVVGPNQTLALGRAASNVKVVSVGTFAGPYVPQPNDSVVYSVSAGAIPPGLTLDPTTGAVSGVPTVFGVSSASIKLTLVHGQSTYTTNAAEVQFSIVEGNFSLSYPACCSASNVGDAVALTLTSGYIPVPGATVSFQFNGDAPPGPVIDAATGAITGHLSAAGTYSFSVTQIAHLPDGSNVYGYSPTVTWSITGPQFTYSAFTLYAFSGTPFSHFPSPITGGLPGDVYTFSVRTNPPATDPLPGWLMIDASTGELFGSSPPPASPGTALELLVTLTTRRNGLDFTTSRRLELSEQ